MVPTILVIEDEEDDVILLRRALGKAGVPSNIQVATNGAEAVEYLSGHGRFSDRNRYPFPNLVFLDLKLPMISGLDLLDWIRNRPECAQLTVVVLTSSPLMADFNQARQRGVSAYFVKPPAPNTLRSVVPGLLEKSFTTAD